MKVITREDVKRIALETGFKEKLQDDGTMDLNEYVYRFADKLYSAGFIEGRSDMRQSYDNNGNY